MLMSTGQRPRNRGLMHQYAQVIGMSATCDDGSMKVSSSIAQSDVIKSTLIASVFILYLVT